MGSRAGVIHARVETVFSNNPFFLRVVTRERQAVWSLDGNNKLRLWKIIPRASPVCSHLALCFQLMYAYIIAEVKRTEGYSSHCLLSEIEKLRVGS